MGLIREFLQRRQILSPLAFQRGPPRVIDRKPAIGTWHTLNYDPDFNLVDSEKSWEPDAVVFKGETDTPNFYPEYHTYTERNRKGVYIRNSVWGPSDVNRLNPNDTWAVVEYEQGTDLWKTYGRPFSYHVPADRDQRVLLTAKYDEWHLDLLTGRIAVFIDLWIKFREPVGTHNLDWAELIVYAKASGGALNPPEPIGIYLTRLQSGGGYQWYMVSYPAHTSITINYSKREYNFTPMFDILRDTLQVDLKKGYVSCVTVGIEATRAEGSLYVDKFDYQFR